MTVYRCLPLWQHGELTSVLVQTGALEQHADGPLVRLPDGHLSEPDDWRPTPSEAWEVAADQIDARIERLERQATACRGRAAEEACS